MARPKKYGRFELTDKEVEYLTNITNTRTEEAQKVQRAKILLLSSAGMSNVKIAEKLDIHRNSVELCLRKYTSSGMESALRDDVGRGRKAILSDEDKTYCNYSCIYCQLGRTDRMTNTRQMFYPLEDIIKEFDDVIKKNIPFDVVTVVGEGEPTLYLGLGELIEEIRKRTDKPVGLITNGALLYDLQVQAELSSADIVLPTLDAYDEVSFKKISRPHKSLNQGKKTLSHEIGLVKRRNGRARKV